MKRGVLSKPESFFSVFDRKGDSDLESTHYCPGCGHGIIHKLLAEAIDELGIADRTIFVSPVGCAVFAYYYFRVGNVQAPHGRAPAVATALKRAHPEAIVICYQGDGDLAAIGGNEILHAANRGENVTFLFVNNAIYGMTGGQMAPTTLPGQQTSTTPGGRDVRSDGHPIRVCELLATLTGPVYLERTALDDTPHISRTRAAIKKALRYQVEGRGFSLVEVLSMCPTGWKLSATDSQAFIREQMMKTYPLGVLRAPETVPDVLPPPPRGPVPAPEELRRMLGLSAVGHDAAPPAVHGHGTQHKLIVAGFGGQGILFLGTTLAKAGMRDGLQVSWIPSYGPEMRGGTAHCSVVLGHQRVGSPIVTRPTVLVAFNQPSVEKFGPRVVPGGLVLYDSSLVSEAWTRADVRVAALPLTGLANDLGAPQIANMVALGALRALCGLVSDASLEAELSRGGNEALRTLNRQAVEAGARAARIAYGNSEASPGPALPRTAVDGIQPPP